jgi:tRNA-dihydrouridine synthase B
MLTVHGRTREQGYKGQAEHDTVAHIKSRVRIPVVANGDINSPEQAREVLRRTGADAIMIGRAAQGRPWIFREIAHFLATGEHLPPPDLADVRVWLLDHLHDHYDLYGEFTGVRSARKHLGWYAQSLPLPAGAAAVFRARVNTTTTVDEQLRCVSESLDAWSSETTTTPRDDWKLAA